MMDYNGRSEWSLEGVRERYRQLASTLSVRAPLQLEPRRHSEGDRQWVYPILDQVLIGAKAGDPACVELAVQLVESSHSQPFGRRLKYRAARTLKKASITPEQRRRLQVRILSVLGSNQLFREFREYARLLRSIGLPDDWRQLCAEADPVNPYVRRYLEYFEQVVRERRQDAQEHQAGSS